MISPICPVVSTIYCFLDPSVLVGAEGYFVFSLGDDQVQDNVECGATFCLGTASATNNTNLERPSDDKIYTVVGIYLGCIAVATCIVAFGLESLKSYNESCKDRKINSASPIELLTITLKMCRHPNILLLIPLTIWSGMEQSFFMADYTAAYVSCARGICYIGYVTVCFGVTDVLSASLTGPLGKALGRVPMISFAAALQVASIVTLLCWKPSLRDKAILFVISGLWGTTDGILSVQSNALYGIFFPGQEEGAYNNFSFWYASGFVVNFAYSSYLCTHIKLYILLAVTLFGLLGYYAVEWLERNKERKSIYFVN
uniref:UNC93-like protein n=1 Tax=Timema douglasi TaxID=61478 RepID=A0A7R8VN98_TIMDO|nr:unnamed protein product [Timema douglasi]